MIENGNNPRFDSESALNDAEICLHEAVEKIQSFVQRANDAEQSYALKKNLPYLITLPLIKDREDELMQAMHSRLNGSTAVLSVSDGSELRHWVAEIDGRNIFVTERRKLEYIESVRKYEFERAEVWLTPPRDIPLVLFDGRQKRLIEHGNFFTKIGVFMSKLLTAVE